jgi:hypothetical protein
MTHAKRAALSIAAVSVAMACLHLYLLDGIVGAALAGIYPDETRYAAQYSDAKFRRLKRGVDEETVRRAIGEPLRERWTFGDCAGDALAVGFDSRHVVEYVSGQGSSGPSSQLRGVRAPEVIDVLGRPKCKALVYSRPANEGSYRVRSVFLMDGRVAKLHHGYYVD